MKRMESKQKYKSINHSLFIMGGATCCLPVPAMLLFWELLSGDECCTKLFQWESERERERESEKRKKEKKVFKFAGRARAASRRDQCRSRSPSEARTAAMMCTAGG